MFAAAWIPAILSAQQEGPFPQMVEELLYRNEASPIPEELFDMQEESGSILLNLNSASPEQLEASGFFTPFQVHQLIRYRDRFGTIYSLYELASLPGFNASKLIDLESCLELKPGPEAIIKKRSKHMLMLDMGLTHPESMAYQANPDGQGVKVYAGSPLHTTLRIRSQTGNHLSMGLTYEKDAGEKAVHKGMPQFLSGYILYQGNRIIKQLLAGTYQLNHGLGLVNGIGFFHHPSSVRVNQRTLSSLRPYASKTEQRYERGIAGRLAWNRFQLLLWASHTKQDLSPGPLIGNPGEIGWWEHQRTTGLHRTIGEIEGRDLAARIRGGAQLLYRQKEFALGIMTGTERMTISKSGNAILGNSYDPFLHHTASLHGTWLRGRWQLFGELATDISQSFACQVGTTVHFNDFLQGTLLAHHFGIGYRGSLPSSYASGSHVANEQGVAFHLHLEPGRLLIADFTGEVFKYPSPRYQTLVPSHAYRVKLSLQNPLINQFHWRFRLVSKTWQSTPEKGTTGVRHLKESRVSRFDCRLVLKTASPITWQSRLIISLLSLTQKPVPAYAALQQANIQITSYLQCTAQFVLFHVEDWENRIYLHEPSFYYSFSFPCYYGRGQKTTFLLKLKAIKEITLSAKISVISYPYRDTLGSGNDVVNGNKKWEAAVQLRLNF
jgi:hypothetical protein